MTITLDQSSWAVGVGAPTGLPTQNCYIYMDQVESNVYLYVNDQWQLLFNLIGSAGVQGQRGSNWTVGTTSPENLTGSYQVDDMYLYQTGMSIYQFNGTDWVLVGSINGESIVGPTGAPGAAGAPGNVWYAQPIAPNSANIGDLWLDTTTNAVYQYQNTTLLPGVINTGNTLPSANWVFVCQLVGTNWNSIEQLVQETSSSITSWVETNYLPLIGGTISGSINLDLEATTNSQVPTWGQVQSLVSDASGVTWDDVEILVSDTASSLTSYTNTLVSTTANSLTNYTDTLVSDTASSLTSYTNTLVSDTANSITNATSILVSDTADSLTSYTNTLVSDTSSSLTSYTNTLVSNTANSITNATNTLVSDTANSLTNYINTLVSGTANSITSETEKTYLPFTGGTLTGGLTLSSGAVYNLDVPTWGQVETLVSVTANSLTSATNTLVSDTSNSLTNYINTLVSDTANSITNATSTLVSDTANSITNATNTLVSDTASSLTSYTNTLVSDTSSSLTNYINTLVSDTSNSLTSYTNTLVADTANSITTMAEKTYLPFTGGTLTGGLTLSSDAVGTLQATPLGQVQTLLSETSTSLSNQTAILVSNTANSITSMVSSTYLPIAGGTLTGNLILNANATLPMQAPTLGQIDTLVSATAATLIPTSSIGVAGGVAPLDSTSKVPIANIPTSLLPGGLTYLGGWNAASNVPNLSSVSGLPNGNYYVVTTAGNTTISGISVWNVGDWLIWNSALDQFQKIDGQANPVASVAGLQGVITEEQLSTALGLTPPATAPFGTITGTVADGGILNTVVNTMLTQAQAENQFVTPKEIQTNSLLYCVDTSTAANLIIANLVPNWPSAQSIPDGMVISVKVANSNTGATSINFAGTGAVACIGMGGPFLGGELIAGYSYQFIYSTQASNWKLLSSTSGALAVGPATQSTQAPQLQQVSAAISTAVSGLAEETWVEQNYALIAGNSTQAFAVGAATLATQAPTAQQVQSNTLNYGVDTSTVANQINVAINPVDTLVDGQKITVKVANTNTGTLVASINGQSNIPIMMPANLPVSGQQVTNLRIDTSTVANTMAISVPSTFTSINNGQDFIVQVANTNTGATTLNVQTNSGTSLGAFPVQSMAGALQGSELVANTIWVFRYNASKSAFVVQGLGSGNTANQSNQFTTLGQVQSSFAAIAGNANQTFAVGNAEQSNQAVALAQLSQLQPLSGSTSTVLLPGQPGSIELSFTNNFPGILIMISNINAQSPSGLGTVGLFLNGARVGGDTVTLPATNITTRNITPGTQTVSYNSNGVGANGDSVPYVSFIFLPLPPGVTF